MKFNKILSLLICVMMLVPKMQFVASADMGKVEFYNSNNEKIEKITDEEIISAKVIFTAPGSAATVITARYASNGALQNATMEKLTGLTKGQTVEHTTNTIGVGGTETVKVFAVDSMRSLVSLLDDAGEVSRKAINVSASATVNAENNVMTKQSRLQSGEVNATVSKGTLLEDGTSTLVLTVKELESTQSGITEKENEIIIPVDVHVEGIAENNTVPVIVTIEDVVMKGMNKGNLTLYHVENCNNVQMVQVDNIENLKEHNQFHYDALKGTLTIAMATFSEIAVVADTENAWNGTYDYSWYTDAVATVAEGGTADYVIANADQFAAFGAIVGGMNGQTRDSFAGKTVTLAADINIGDKDNANTNLIFHPIGYYYTDDKNADGTTGDYYSTVNSFEGTFNGNGHTIADFYQNTWEIKGDYDGNYYKDAMGLFGYVNGGTVKNLTVDNFSSDGEFTPTGVIAAYAVNSTFENIAITNCNPRVYNTGNGGIVGIGGNSDDPDTYELTFTNITIDNSNIISALWGSWDVACGGLIGMFRGAGHVHMTNCHVAAQMDVYNDVCGNYQYYWYRYAGMMVGTNKNMITDANGYTVPETSKFHAENCTVHFGEWNDYYYCELVANSIASYTHDHQFSRLTEIASLDEIKSGDTWTKTGNFLLISGDTKTCYHIVKNTDGTLKQHLHSDAGTETVDGKTVDVEDKKIVYLPFNQLFTGYGWGVKHIPVYNGEDYAFEGVTILDRDVADSVVKFETKFTGDFLYRVGNAKDSTVALGTLFEAVAGQTINNSGVTVTIDKVDENTNAGGTYKADTSDWTKGTIQFSGTGVVKVTIQDYNYCTPTVLYLEVVDAVNATGATSATVNNVVLLNDISGTFKVSNGYSFYGNGFTVTCSGNGSYGSKALSFGFITVSNGGILDNVQVICDIFPASYLYTSEMEEDDGKYPYAYSAVTIENNSTISNCYIYGARNNIYVGTGNVNIENTVTECGSLSNIQIKSSDANTVTLDNVTTIQYQTTSEYDTSKKVLGFGVVVGDNESASNPTIKITGDLKQYNWVTTDDESVSNTYAKTAITEALKVEEYQHAINGTTTVNMGIAYLNAQTATITDERNNKGTIPYKLKNITMSGQTGQVYSISGSDTITADSRYDAKKDEVIPYSPAKNRIVVPTVTFTGDTTEFLNFESGYNSAKGKVINKLTVDLDNISGGSYDFKFSSLNVQKYGVNLEFTVTDSSGNYVDKNTPISLNQLLTAEYCLKATDNLIFDANGAKSDETENHNLLFVISATKTSIEPPEFTNSGTATAIRLVEKSGGDWRPAYTALTGVSVTYWSASESKVKTVDLSTLYNSGTISSNVWTYTCDDYTLTITGGAVHSDGSVITPVVANNTLYFASTNKAFGTGTTSRNIILTYVFTDKNASTSWERTEAVTYSELSEYDYNSFKNNGTLTEPSSCVTPDTLITLADGKQKEVQYLNAGDELLVWNLKTGKYDTAPIVFNESDAKEKHEIIHLYFADGSDVEVIYEHGFFDVNIGEYVYIRSENAKNYIGHEFVTKGDTNKNTWKTSKLTNVVFEKKVTTPYSPVTFEHLCYFTDGVLSIPGGIGGMFNVFEVDINTMKYDSGKMSRDIENYGLFTYKDFENIIPEYAYEAFNGKYLKVAIGKGLITWNDISRLAERYGMYF